ncbi:MULTISPECIES: pyridoxamine 5'-phosphate oxidase family protein [Actinomadura]|uniref:Pyridoxamine 5'-phosphate oxidase family protein n=1 Tax=Actinomadura litoris TaxID=2678616 RepID=A0A7K1L5G9_9ACTN|nr:MULTISPECIES: pyridoxamine 5'-phosphate oxidase family protein [Actinomadura]MBT2212696.1 pyridoxamine 5'-phosphate oxidase family protein [Actinomadura sp. NEAU-AAG7]MUN39672.1 pyridoxamine 5'-phosphate oxidase family protein [Actinomadura litoris]
MQFDHGGLEILDTDECRALLSRAVIGRIVFTDRALPAVQPVNYALHGTDVVIRTARDSRLARAATDTVVAFEIDDFDADTRTGWSVVVVGRARLVTEHEQIAVLQGLPLHSWVPEERDHFITVRTELLSGRRIPHTPMASAKAC